jgi:hypothetical protein
MEAPLRPTYMNRIRLKGGTEEMMMKPKAKSIFTHRSASEISMGDQKRNIVSLNARLKPTTQLPTPNAVPKEALVNQEGKRSCVLKPGFIITTLRK